MKKITFIFLSTVLFCSVHAQTDSQLKAVDSVRKFLATTDFVYPYLDTPPGYVGGEEKWREYQRKSTVLKEAVKAAKEKKIPAGKYVVVVNFNVNPDGSIADVKTTNKAIGYGLDEAALNFVKGSGKWIPANIEGQNTKSAINLPVTFTIDYE